MGQVWRMKIFREKILFLSFFFFPKLGGRSGKWRGGGRGMIIIIFFFLSKAKWAKWEMEGGKSGR